jgi:hypothetical protein
MLAAKYLASQTGKNNVITLETVQVRKPTHQICNGYNVLAFRSPPIDRIDPLFGCPRPESPLPLSHLTKKEEQNVLAMVGNDHPAGTKTGDVLHIFKSGTIQMVTDVSIDPAGNVWVANNWNLLEAAAGPNPAFPTSTWGGGSGFTVIYGAAAPVKPPRMGKVQTY